MSSPPTPITTSLDGKISPSVLLIIAILSIIFFLSGLIHLLIRFLLRPPAIDHDRTDTVTALQGQLQQLFHLHDAGVDQSYIDTLPVFFYKSVVGVKGPFDCAVCLCEFEPDDKLRLLPKCSHAFHVECIDTWLLSHSTCPLCRGTLVPEFSPGCSPVVLVLESGDESSAEIVPDPSIDNSNSGPPREDVAAKEVPSEEKVVSVKLGKFRNLDAYQEGCSSSGDSTKNLDGRRCFSMGSFEYVMDEKATLRVAIKPQEKKSSENNRRRSRLAMSECDLQSQRDGFIGFDKKAVVKRESFSVSKTWLRPKEAGSEDGSRRTFSFRKQKEGSRAWSEFDSGSEFDVDVEAGSCNNGRMLSRREECPSFARRTLLWVMGRNHKVGNHVGFG